MSDPLDPNHRVTGVQWRNKFGYAFAGIRDSFLTQASFWVHLPAAVVVIALAAFLQLESWRWAVLILCIAIVIAAELFNTAMEQVVVVLHPVRDPRIARALDAAAASVLVVAVASVAVGLIVLGPPLLEWLGVLGNDGDL
ncbi:Undecaprenol kinase [Rubripirellula obstinata]|uniref:Undecaprenol kinase n=1 Tax=Rubripirellula obstinata TaxID=406547 RepID=A0A5B1CPW6_9BACT|nr:diacylglycerol kinase [Rubripirellula obstinata]KAA1261899.1 Undecaprenol kinase [Rubripirellula obstinata]